jgi:hypothetical protein
MNIWLKHPRTNKEDTMLTLAVASTLVVLVKFIFSGVVLGDVSLGTIDAGVVAAILTPTLGSYVARKYTDKPKGQKT